MKKSLIALAVMAAAGAASAQSSVTLFGIVDTAFQYGRAAGTGGNHVRGMTTGAYSTSRLGFRGREDLGGGLRAEFWLEGQLFTDDGRAGSATTTGNQALFAGTTTTGATVPGVTGNAGDGAGLNFARRLTVSLGGDSWGEVRLGRDVNVSGVVPAAYDAFGAVGSGIALPTAGVQGNTLAGVANSSIPFATTRSLFARSSNMVQYFLPANLGGFFGAAGYWFGENRSNVGATSGDGDGGGVRLGFGTGPWKVEGSWARTDFAQTAATGDYTAWDLGGQWDFGVARLMGFYRSDEINRTGTDLHSKGWSIGSLIPVGPGEIRVAYSALKLTEGVASKPRARKLSLGYVHNLSKRTALYTTLAFVRNSGGSAVSLGGSGGATWAANQSSSGFDLGIRHAF